MEKNTQLSELECKKKMVIKSERETQGIAQGIISKGALEDCKTEVRGFKNEKITENERKTVQHSRINEKTFVKCSKDQITVNNREDD